MLVPINWLKDYTEVTENVKEFTDNMIMSGSNLETVEKMPQEMKGVVVGRIDKLVKHPKSDHLSICQVDIGKGEDIQVICGAPNVAEGMMVPVAPVGAHIPGPLHGQEPVPGGIDVPPLSTEFSHVASEFITKVPGAHSLILKSHPSQ